MSDVVIAPDGAKKRFLASQENIAAQKQEMVVRGKDLRKKIKKAEDIKSLKEHIGWKMIQEWYTGKWAYELIMNAFRNEPEKCKEMMYQREALTMMENQIEAWVNAGEQARKELIEEEERNKT